MVLQWLLAFHSKSVTDGSFTSIHGILLRNGQHLPRISLLMLLWLKPPNAHSLLVTYFSAILAYYACSRIHTTIRLIVHQRYIFRVDIRIYVYFFKCCSIMHSNVWCFHMPWFHTIFIGPGVTWKESIFWTYSYLPAQI